MPIQFAKAGDSHVIGDSSPELSSQTISQLLDAAVTAGGNAEAVVFAEAGVRLTWLQLQHTSDRLAAGLLVLGLQKGDRIGIWSPNRPEWVLTAFACARIGAILVNINPAYRLSELEYSLNKVGCKAIISAAGFKSSDYLGMLRVLAPELSTSEPGNLQALKLPHLRWVIRMGLEISPGMLNFDDVLNMADATGITRAHASAATLVASEPINIQFTSGTTGNPKGATLAHFNIVNNARFVAYAMNLSEHDILCIPVPLYHCFGLVMGVLSCTAVHAKMVFPSEGFEPGATLRALAAEACTAIHGVPTMFIAQLGHADFGKCTFGALRTGIMAGAPCPIEVMKRVVNEMGAREVTIAYGMTETSPVSFQTDAKDPLERRVSTVGRVQPHLEVKVIDAVGNTVAVGERGELCTKGYSVMLGYWDDAPRTQEAVRDGWMHTGDLATIDADGYCNIVGRVKDMLIRGGENVYPREIEEFLFKHPKVQQVQVFGVPDARYGEEIAAWIILKPNVVASEDEIKTFCRGQIAHYKIPRYVRFVQDLPMTVTGKAQKFVMRDLMMIELGLRDEETA